MATVKRNCKNFKIIVCNFLFFIFLFTVLFWSLLMLGGRGYKCFIPFSFYRLIIIIKDNQYTHVPIIINVLIIFNVFIKGFLKSHHSL